jgi:hypothetical protein
MPTTPSFWSVVSGCLQPRQVRLLQTPQSAAPQRPDNISSPSPRTQTTSLFSALALALALIVALPDTPLRAQSAPSGSAFAPPAENACKSNYDQFYEGEPGVYAYWSLCEPGSPATIYDYVGEYDFTKANNGFGIGTVVGGLSGPVPDGETAAGVSTAAYFLANLGIPLNKNGGTIATWINADATTAPVQAITIYSDSGHSKLAIGLQDVRGDVCFTATYEDLSGSTVTAQSCGYAPNSWHRVALTWSSGSLALYMDGKAVATAKYAKQLDTGLFWYRLFPRATDTGKQMTLAKVLVSNRAWSASQMAEDAAPAVPQVPTGGIFVSRQGLGIIHKDVLGYADLNQQIDTAAWSNALVSGLKTAGVTAVRYSAGYGGITADLNNWQGTDGGRICSKLKNVPGAPQNLVYTGNNLDAYMQKVVQPLGLDMVYTVNYGTNPPDCDAGGDPVANGASLVQSANIVRGYGIKYFEIGNEVFSTGTEADFHPNPNTGASYASYEPTYYGAMKAKDPTIQIGVPVGITNYPMQTSFDFPVFNSAIYDAVVFHNYPMVDPITDGDTLYQDRVASTMHRTRGSLLKMQTELLAAGKQRDAIWVTEWNGEVYGNEWSRQTMGAVAPLFAASQLAEYMRVGVKLATWWAQGTPNGCSTNNYDHDGETAYSWVDCGTTALVYAGANPYHNEQAVGLQPGNLLPVAHAFEVLSKSGFITEGEQMLNTVNDMESAPWLLSYAATHGSSYAVILINRDRDAAHTAPVKIQYVNSGKAVLQWTYGRAQYDKTETGDWSAGAVQTTYGAWNGTFNATLPPWSVSVFVFE